MVLFLAAVARFYHPGTGFTALIAFPEGHEYEAPALRGVPHYQYPARASYDGQFYAQRALDPLVRDPQVDRAMDLAPYRARRILFSWTAYALGLGRPAWILEAFALQNVLSWLILAGLLTRWLPLGSVRALFLWTACLFSHGLLWSVRFSLLDGPSLVLTTLAVIAAERDRYLLSAAIVGVNGLGRETNLLALLAQRTVARPARSVEGDRRGYVRGMLRLCASLVLGVLPLLIWEDYLYSIYRSTIFSGGDQVATPGSAFVSTANGVLTAVRWRGVLSSAGLQACIVAALAAQGIYLVVRRRPDIAWWRVAIGYAVLMLLIDRVLWAPSTGAITRVMLPMTVGFNVLLVREQHPVTFWSWFAIGNLHVVPAFRLMPFV